MKFIILLEAQEKLIDDPSKKVQAGKTHTFILHYVFLEKWFGQGVVGQSMLQVCWLKEMIQLCKVEVSLQYE